METDIIKKINKKEANKRWREKNKKQKSKIDMEWKKKNPDKVKINARRYREKHKERLSKYNQDWDKENKDKRVLMQKRYAENNQQKLIAQRLARKFVKKEKSCQICGDKQNLERHHWRYDKPLMVATLCKFCHTDQHNKNVIFAGGRR